MMAPTARPARIATTSGHPDLTKVTPTMEAARPLIEPTDRSISPSSSTSTMPMAMMPIGAHSAA